MFAIKFLETNSPGNTHECTYHAYSYSVDKPQTADRTPVITMALAPDVSLYQDHKAHIVHVTGVAFVMNEHGKTIDTIRNDDAPIPPNERWLHEPAIAEKLNRAIAEAAKTQYEKYDPSNGYNQGMNSIEAANATVKG